MTHHTPSSDAAIFARRIRNEHTTLALDEAAALIAATLNSNSPTQRGSAARTLLDRYTRSDRAQVIITATEAALHMHGVMATIPTAEISAQLQAQLLDKWRSAAMACSAQIKSRAATAARETPLQIAATTGGAE